MKLNTENLITDLVSRTHHHMEQVENFRNLNEIELNWKSNPNSWSVLECIEHLNMYGDYYVPEIKKRLRNNETIASAEYSPGLLGNYFAEMMLPKEKFKKMKTMKDKDPINSNLGKTTLDTFLNQQKELLEILEKAKSVHLGKTKTSISISSFIKLKLGDTLRVVIYHNHRHVLQAENVLKAKAADNSSPILTN